MLRFIPGCLLKPHALLSGALGKWFDDGCVILSGGLAKCDPGRWNLTGGGHWGRGLERSSSLFLAWSLFASCHYAMNSFLSAVPHCLEASLLWIDSSRLWGKISLSFFNLRELGILSQQWRSRWDIIQVQSYSVYLYVTTFSPFYIMSTKSIHVRTYVRFPSFLKVSTIPQCR